MTEVPLTDWCRFLEDFPEAHILQSGEWGELKSGFGWQAARLRVGALGAQILFRKLPLGYSFAYLAKGPVGIGNDTHAQTLWAEMERLCTQRRAVFIKIEPDAWENEPAGSSAMDALARAADGRLKPAAHSIQPRRTITVDLRGSEEDILARMKPKCRYNIGLARRKGIMVGPWDDIAGFHEMMMVTAKRDGFAVHSAEYMRKAYELFQPAGHAAMLGAFHEGRPLAALMVFQRGRRAWYLYGASTDEKRELMPNYLLQWEGMRWARQRGAEEYDLWGVPDEAENTLEARFEDRHDGLWGVYRFKRGFGGEVHRAASAEDRVYQPILYALYRSMMARRSTP